ncbi:hypothetical protein Q5P01_007286 [Channa striata]|uniref:Uncharacterized protein n=1 Tax=Channa striata TaxID=64152 RepID=A0AA88N3D7_CHASR|nr:hypothetical protein Q5P01_007286 [Channa striata]
MHTAKGVCAVEICFAALPSCHRVQCQHSIRGLSAFTCELGESVSQPATPTGCPSCLLRMTIRMKKRGSEPSGQDGGRRWSVKGQFERVSGGVRCVQRGEEECP